MHVSDVLGKKFFFVSLYKVATPRMCPLTCAISLCAQSPLPSWLAADPSEWDSSTSSFGGRRGRTRAHTFWIRNKKYDCFPVLRCLRLLFLPRGRVWRGQKATGGQRRQKWVTKKSHAKTSAWIWKTFFYFAVFPLFNIVSFKNDPCASSAVISG